MKRVLLIPSDHGGGRGHVSRCIYLAKKLQASGVNAALVLENKHFKAGIDSGIPTYLLNTRKEKYLKLQIKKPHLPKIEMVDSPSKPPVFLVFDGLAYQVPRDEYLSQRIVRRRFRQLEKITERFKPDVLIGDTHFLTFLLGKKLNIPVIQITRLAGFPPDPKFFWWLKQPPRLIHPDALQPFRVLLDSLSVSDVQKTEDLLRGDLYLIPSSPSVEPVDGKQKNIVFSGALSEISDVVQKIPFFDEQNEVPKIYVTTGGGANRFSEQQFFEAVLNLFDRTDFKVLVSTAGAIPAKTFNGRSANVLFTDWVDGVSAIRKSDLVIHHGGYGSTVEILVSGKPSIVIPFHSEQEGNGRRLKELQVGEIFLPYRGELKELKFGWPYGVYTMLGGMELNLDRTQIFPLIEQIYDQSLYERLNKIKDELTELQKNFDPLKLLKSL